MRRRVTTRTSWFNSLEELEFYRKRMKVLLKERTCVVVGERTIVGPYGRFMLEYTIFRDA